MGSNNLCKRGQLTKLRQYALDGADLRRHFC